ncbi:MAG: hypothetical protein FJZ01_03170 [Candidatus Sericytochromatia bacterium]|nr:hypothetical protein [Candidatus Tanganyikabacteria bacterium]
MAVILGEIIGLLAVVMVLGIPLSFSPLGKALAERIRAGTVPGDAERRLHDLEAEVAQLREIVVMSEAAKRPAAKLSEPDSQPAARPARELQ